MDTTVMWNDSVILKEDVEKHWFYREHMKRLFHSSSCRGLLVRAFDPHFYHLIIALAPYTNKYA